MHLLCHLAKSQTPMISESSIKLIFQITGGFRWEIRRGIFFFYSEYSYIRTHKNTEVISLNWYNLSHEIIEKPKLKWVELLVHWTNLTVPSANGLWARSISLDDESIYVWGRWLSKDISQNYNPVFLRKWSRCGKERLQLKLC